MCSFYRKGLWDNWLGLLITCEPNTLLSADSKHTSNYPLCENQMTSKIFLQNQIEVNMQNGGEGIRTRKDSVPVSKMISMWEGRKITKRQSKIPSIKFEGTITEYQHHCLYVLLV